MDLWARGCPGARLEQRGTFTGQCGRRCNQARSRIILSAVLTALASLAVIKRLGIQDAEGKPLGHEPKVLGKGVRYVAGGLIFGLGWALTGACPGPLVILVGAGMPGKADDGSPPPPMAEGKFMSMKRRQPGGDSAPAVVSEFNGKLVSIGGYIVPLDFENTTIKEFLLVPYVGACIHVPPPPSTQIIYVKSGKGIEITGQFDPVNVIGTMKTETAFTGLADAGYSLSADSVEVLKP